MDACQWFVVCLLGVTALSYHSLLAVLHMLTHPSHTPYRTALKVLKIQTGTTLLTCRMSLQMQIGQVILTYPYQMALMGVIPAIIVAIGVGLLNYYTLWLLIVLYLERKRFMVSALLC